ncbi:hypothetical protein Van01_64810 [Micromonospora andamanensis]|uniref:Signal transduction histidine kinase subgroup 3 dimerisation and phosphoacceptor domain-containing protein n=1 Tax=Micromonospora andamanensis TaxID=1287068 RepID=A0ABQ4I5V5_9ACTN|nr:hypothetical protein Van01_64810 [Micromonospora andamanensis]GIJ43054.1 hypothetical protein Vwe01_63790 [Micromonospora andamanensis]
MSDDRSIPLLTNRQCRLFLVGVNVVFGGIFIGLSTINEGEADGRSWAFALLAALGVAELLLNLRHSFAFSEGRYPPGWRWTFAAMVVIFAVPLWWSPFQWTLSGNYLVASAWLLLPRWLAVVTTVSAAAATIGVYYAHYNEALWASGGWLGVVLYELYVLVVLVTGSGALFWSARLARAVHELSSARAALAEVAVQGERQRILRDLHDLLGQSLSAVSLKGDLALRLLSRDPAAAREELDGLVAVARTALRDSRNVSREAQRVSLRSEIDGAVALLTAAGIHADVHVSAARVSRQAEELFAWAVREGTTNMLRHSEARRCWLRIERRTTTVRLEIVNDGARPGAANGSGLAGLDERARAAAGSVQSGLIGGGQFLLAVEAPGGDL